MDESWYAMYPVPTKKNKAALLPKSPNISQKFPKPLMSSIRFAPQGPRAAAAKRDRSFYKTLRMKIAKAVPEFSADLSWIQPL